MRSAAATSIAGTAVRVGGYVLVIESLLPLVHDPNTREGREALGLFGRRRHGRPSSPVLPGDDASCLNLYEPRTRGSRGAAGSFLRDGRFAFQGIAGDDRRRARQSVAAARAARAGRRDSGHRRRELDDLRAAQEARRRDRAAARRSRDPPAGGGGAADSIFQGELLMSEANFVRCSPNSRATGSCSSTPRGEPSAESAGGSRTRSPISAPTRRPTAERLAEFHRVENTYLSTFQTLGGLGLLLGTIGLAAVLLRNVLERRRELALLGAVGYARACSRWSSPRTCCCWSRGWRSARQRVHGDRPAALERGVRLPLTSGRLAAAASPCFVTGLLSSLVAMRAATRSPLLGSSPIGVDSD